MKLLLLIAFCAVALATVDERLARLEHENQVISAEINTLDSTLEAIKKAQADQKIAFMAECQSNVGPGPANYIIPYSRVITNIGNGFSTSSYTFVAPVKGLYFFHWNLYGEDAVRAPCAYLALNNQWVISSVMDRKDFHSARNSATLQLNPGDQVNVRLTQNTCGVFLNTRNGMLDRATTFSGFLIDTV